MFDCDDYLSSRSDESLPPSPIYHRYQSGNGYHVVPPPHTRTFMPPKPDLVFNNAPNDVKTDHPTFNVKLSPTKPNQDLSHTNRPSAPIIEDWVFDSEDESKHKTTQNVLSFVQPFEQVKTPMTYIQYVETSITPATSKIAIPKPLSNGKYRNRKVCFVCKSLDHLIKDCDYHEKKMAQPTARNHVQRGTHKQYAQMPLLNPQRHVVPATVLTQSKLVPINVVFINAVRPGNPQHDLKDKGVINSGCLRHMIGNMSIMFDFKELNGGYVAFGGNPKGGKFDGKVDEGFLVKYSVSSKAFRVFNSRTRIVYETLDVNFLENKHNVAGEDIKQQYVLSPVWSSSFINPQNTNGDAAFDEKEPEFDEKKLESELKSSPSNSAQSKKHDDKTKRKAKGKSLVESFTGYIKLSAEFEDFSDNIINEVNATGTLVPAVGKISSNSTNTFSVVGPSNAATSPTHGKSSYDVGAEADFNNLETSITVSHIPTTRVYKDHYVTQIIGDLSSATQTRSMTRVAKDQGGASLIQNAEGLGLSRFLYGKRAIGYTQEEGIDYKEVFALVARIEAIRLFLAYASFMGFMIYQMDVKSAFLYETIKEEVYVCQPLGFEDPDYPDKKKDGIFISQLKYVAEILRKFRLTDGKSTSTPINTEKPLLKDPDGKDVDVHTYGSIIRSLMYLTSSRPDIMFAVCACARFQVTPKASHLHAVKRIFRYLKGKPHLGLWYPKDSSFDLVAYSDCDYAGVSLDRKSTTRGCQFFGCRLISWQCKKQIVVATSSTEAKYVAAASCCTQVLWIPNQLLDYGSIKYDLTVKPNIYVTCIKQFWTTVAVKKVNDITRLQALVDKKKVVVTEATIKDALHLDDAEGKGFFGVETPLFEAMIVEQHVAEGDADEVHGKDVNAAGVVIEGVVSAVDDVVPTTDEEPSIPSHTPPTLPPQPSQDIPSTAQAQVKKLEKRNKLKVLKLMRLQKEAKDVAADIVKDGQDADVQDNADIQGRTEEKSEPIELQEVVEVVTTAKIITQVVTAASITITAIDVPIPAATTAATPILTTAPKLEVELNRTIDWDEVINHVNKKAKKDNDVKRYQAIKRKPQTKTQARKNMMIYLKNVNGFKMDYFKEMSYDDIRPVFEKYFDLNIVPNDEDDVHAEAIPLVLKVPIVDYEIYNQNNKPYYKTKRADGSHQLYLSFLSLLRNFDKEDLEALWRLVKERFATIKPKNFFDDFLLITLRAMFEKPDIHAQI
nr:uncharacterized mitochondrial protein AtMg00810-like [Tanacetum cinerariifolium]